MCPGIFLKKYRHLFASSHAREEILANVYEAILL